MRLLGRAGVDLLPILNKGSEGLKKQFEIASKYKTVVAEDMVAAGQALDEANKITALGIGNLKKALMTELAPAVTVVIEGFNAFVLELIKSYKEGGVVKDMVTILVGTFKVLASTVATIALVFTEMYRVVKLVISALTDDVLSLGRIIVKVFSGDLAGAMEEHNSRVSRSARRTIDSFREMKGDAQKYADFMKKLWGAEVPQGKTRETSDEAYDDGSAAAAAAKRAAAEARRAAAERLRIALEELSYKQELAGEELELVMKLEQEKLALIKDFYGEDSQEYIRALRAKERLARNQAQVLLRVEENRIQQMAALKATEMEIGEQLNQMEIDADIQKVNTLERLGRLTSAQAIQARAQLVQESIAQEARLAESLYNIKRESVESRLRLEGLTKAARASLYAQLEQMKLEHEGRMVILTRQAAIQAEAANNEAALAAQQRWMGITQPIASAFNGMFNSLYTYSANFKDSLLQALDQIVLSFVQQGFQMVAQWAANELAKTSLTTAGVATRTGVQAAGTAAEVGMETVKTAATVTGVAIRTGAEVAGAATSTAASAKSGIAQVAHSAIKAAAGAYSAIASIPVVGPILAPIAAAGALAAVYALGKSIFSASGGFDIPGGVNPLTQLHEKEMVLPAHIAEPLRASLRNASPRSSGLSGMVGAATSGVAAGRSSSVTFNYSPTTNAQNMSIQEALRRDSSAMRRWFQNEMRNNNLRME
jgi:hypothetical protein